MQVIVLIIVLLILLSFIIYKINNKFGTKELLILLVIVVIAGVGTLIFSKTSEEKVPKLFKEKYEKTHNVLISNFTYERLNNKTVSSNTNFIYDFEYIIKKDGNEFICSAKKVEIKKIEDEYVFINFNNLKEECKKN